MKKRYESRFDDKTINYWTMQYVWAENREEANAHFAEKAKLWGCIATPARLSFTHQEESQ